MGEFECKDMKVVMAEKDQLTEEKKQIEDEKRRIEEKLEAEKQQSEEKLEEEKKRRERDLQQQKKELELESRRAFDQQILEEKRRFEDLKNKEIQEERAKLEERKREEIEAFQQRLQDQEATLKEKDREAGYLQIEKRMKEEFKKEEAIIRKDYEAKIEKLNMVIKETEEKAREKEKEALQQQQKAREEFDKEKAKQDQAHREELTRREEIHKEELEKKLSDARTQGSEFEALRLKMIEEMKVKDIEIQQMKTSEDNKERFSAELAKLKGEYETKLSEKDKRIRELENEARDLQMNAKEEKRDLERKMESEKMKLENEKREQERKMEAERIRVLQEQQEQERRRQMKEKDDQIRVEKEKVEEAKTRQAEEEARYKDFKETFLKEAQKDDDQFAQKCPALLSRKDGGTSPGLLLINALKEKGTSRFQRDFNIPLRREEEIQNRSKGIAARMFSTKYPPGVDPDEPSGFTGAVKSWIAPAQKAARFNKTIMLLGLTGAGKTTFIDAFINFVFDIRFEDENRLRLVSLTKEEREKQDKQAHSQTDHIVVYKIKALPEMNINHDLTIIDSPGFGDTRGVDYDKKLMQNIEDLFKSKKVDSLDAIGFVAKAGDARLTAQQKYIFESILHIFGKDVKDNLLSILTCYDGQSVNILDSFEEANMRFEENFPVNSEAIFQNNAFGKSIDKGVLLANPGSINYQHFFDESKRLAHTLLNMAPRSLALTLNVLEDRERIEVEMQGMQENVTRLLMQKDTIRQETDICNQHKANADANEDTEYEVEEQVMKKVQLDPGTYVTNCLSCNRTCHFPCAIPNDDGKAGCAAMRGGFCTVCPEKCFWQKHVNNQYRSEISNIH